MRTAKQLSVSLVNKPGRLADMLGALAKGKVNFLALSVMDSRDRGMVRFVPDEFDAATEVLEKLNIRFDAADVLLVDVPNQNGAFRNICERLASDHLNIDYAYCSVNTEKGAKGNMLAVIKVNDLSKAQKVLQTNGQSKRQLPGRRPVHAR
ncbi:MAG: hypothetical protein GXX96_23385 [Planctomycetaceae bacterium]|jgi:hypothetical protein|nr:hypothetical protein [Planctomycetaceae bacterium]